MSRQDDVAKLIKNHKRRLQKLREKQAVYGLETPIHILIEIEDIEAVVEKLVAELATLAEDRIDPSSQQLAGERRGDSSGMTGKDRSTLRSRPLIFVGREAQRRALDRHWQAAVEQHQGQVVFLTGEAGIGKTSLIQQFSRRVLEYYPTARYAYTQCDQLAGDISPYAPFIQILGSLTEQAARRRSGWSTEYLREVGPDILSMVPVAGPLLAATAKSVDFVWQRQRRITAGDTVRAQFGQQDLLQEFSDALRNIALKNNPLLLCIDDWHWADTSSTNLLFHLARQVAGVPLLLVASYRPHDAEVSGHPIINVQAEMERYHLCTHLPLEFLSRAEVEGYLAERFPTAHFTADFITWLMRTTTGNALFVTEYLNLMVNEQHLTSDGQLTGDFEQLNPPESVEAVIRSRIGYLDREARDMLAYGSVTGEQFTTLLLSRVLDIQPLTLIRRLRTIEETHQLITSLGQQSVYDQKTTVYRFVHALIYQALNNMLEAEERVEIHRMLLELLKEIYDQATETTKGRLLPELMTHAAQAQEHLIEARYALTAAEHAAEGYAHPEVLKHCRRGLRALDNVKPTIETEAIRMDLLLLQANTEHFIGTSQQALETYRQAETLARTAQDEAKLLEGLHEQGWVLWSLGRYAQAQHCFEEADRLAQQMNDKKMMARVYEGFGAVQYKMYNYDLALVWMQKALDIAQALDDKERMATVHNNLGHIYELKGDDDQALKHIYQGMALNEETGNIVQLGWNCALAADIYADQGDEGQALALLQRALANWEDACYRRGEWNATLNLGWYYLRQGEPDQALVWFQKSRSISELMGEKDHLADTYLGLGRVYRMTGDDEQALDVYHKAITLKEEAGNEQGLGVAYSHTAHFYKERSDTAQALTLFQKALAISQKIGYQRHEAFYSFYIGTVYESENDYPQALTWYQKALAIQEALDNQDYIDRTREHIVAIEAKMVEGS